jgi:hypothetical protein
MTTEQLITKYRRYVSSLKWNLENHDFVGDRLISLKNSLECYNEILSDLAALSAATPSPEAPINAISKKDILIAAGNHAHDFEKKNGYDTHPKTASFQGFIAGYSLKQEEAGTWVNVEDGLPELNIEYNVAWDVDGGKLVTTTMEFNVKTKDWLDVMNGGIVVTELVKFWRELPAPPESYPTKVAEGEWYPGKIYQRLFNVINESAPNPLESQMQDIIQVVHEDFPKVQSDSPLSGTTGTDSNSVVNSKNNE